jgi:hypothetical protein
MRFIYMFLAASLIGGTALAAFATMTDATARRIDNQQVQSLRQGSVHHGPGLLGTGRRHSGGGFFGGK